MAEDLVKRGRIARIEDLWDPATNLDVGAEHLRTALDAISGVAPALLLDQGYRMALWAYNGGLGYVLAAIRTLQGNEEDVNPVTVARVLPTAKVGGRVIRHHLDVQHYADRILGPLPPGATALVEAVGRKGKGVLLLVLALGLIFSGN